MERHPRRSAWEFLRDVERDNGYINIAISDLYPQLDQRDRAFVTELVFGSVRMRLLLDFIIDQLAARTIDDETRSVLRLGFYEAFFMSTADHAVVNEYVEMAKSVIGRARSGFVNALLRRGVRERSRLLDLGRLPVDVRTSHPSWIVEAYRSLLGHEAVESELTSHNVPAAVHLVSFEDLPDEIATKSPITTFGYRLKVPPHEVAGIRSGRSFVQDEGSQLVCEIALATDPDRRLRWLDLCAGPGGKFSFLAHFLDPEHLQGNELHPHRVSLIKSRSPHHHISTGDARSQSFEKAPFDRVLIDAPCTGIGALRRRPDARWRRSEDDLKGLVLLQRQILDSAAGLLDEEGLIFYVTCSPHLMETKAQVFDFLARHKNFALEPISLDLLPEVSRSQLAHAITDEGFLQLFTARDGTDAMFMAVLKRVS